MSYFIDNFYVYLILLAKGLFTVRIYGILLNKKLFILMCNIKLMFLSICLLFLLIYTNFLYFNSQIYTLIVCLFEGIAVLNP